MRPELPMTRLDQNPPFYNTGDVSILNPNNSVVTPNRRAVLIEFGAEEPGALMIGQSNQSAIGFFGGNAGRGVSQPVVASVLSNPTAVTAIAQAFSDPVTGAEAAAFLAAINDRLATIEGNSAVMNNLNQSFGNLLGALGSTKLNLVQG